MPFPTSNLSTAALPWGREVEKQINSLTATVKANEVNNSARDNQLSSSLTRLAAAQKKADEAFAATGIISGEVAALETDVTALDVDVSDLTNNVYYPGTTTINGGNIRTGTITATQISTNYVYAGTVNANQINAGTLTGFTLQTASSGRRVVIGGTTATFYDESNDYTGTITVSGTGNSSVMTINGPFTSRSISFSSIGTLISGGSGTSIYMNDNYQVIVNGGTLVAQNGLDVTGSSIMRGNFSVPGSSSFSSGWQGTGGSQIGSGVIASANSGGNAAGFSRYGSTGTVVTFYNGTTTATGSIGVTASATSYNTSSDYRLKENVIPLTGAMDRLNALKPSKFNFIIEPDKTVDGFIAHEVSEVVPEAVIGEKDAVNEDGSPDYQGIDQSKLVPLVVAAVQELAQKVKTLEEKA